MYLFTARSPTRIGDKKKRKRFAFFPTKMSNMRIYWLCFYCDDLEYENHWDGSVWSVVNRYVEPRKKKSII